MLYLSAVILSFFLAFVLLTKKNKTPGDKVLVAWLAVIGMHLLGFYFFFTGYHIRFPAVVGLAIPLPLMHGPFLYLYTTSQTTGHPFRKKQLIHFFPVLLSYVLFYGFFLLSPAQQLEVIREKGKGYETQTMINLAAIYLSGIVYIAVSVKQLLAYRKRLVHQFSNTEKINFNWLLYLITWMVVIWIVVLFVHKDEWLFGIVAFFVAWLGYFGIKQVQVFSQRSNVIDAPGKETVSIADLPDIPVQKYQRSTLSDKEASVIHQRLSALMETSQPYKDPELTLNALAASLEVHPNVLSQVINSKENKSFYDLINEKRVQEFILLCGSELSQQYTLLSLAFDCGFNSKASFNRNFKKYMGITPSDYLKQQPQPA